PYMLLVMEPTGQSEARSLPEGHEAYDRMVRFGDRLRAKGILKASDSLGPTSKGTRVQVRDGKRSLVDGPFAEAKEIVGGFFLLDCSKDEANAAATTCPAAEFATIEVREVGPCWEK
ncbi:MAG: hypothetical protein QOH67_1347, partial [Hyphomicrobiales bacterium]|nr:hypothetical protein [Hyphomicrobiales bacterium]